MESLHTVRRVIQQQIGRSSSWMMLTTLEANIVPVVFEAPERCVIDKRLEGYKKGLKAEDIYRQ